MLSRADAQARADRIRAWREELAAAERDGALSLTPEQRTGIVVYHDALLAELSRAYDVDTSEAQHHLSLGMRVVSLLGAAALTGAVVLFFLDIWGALGSAAQVAIVASAPLVALALAAYAADRERTRYFTAILSFLALGCFILDVSVLGTVLNARPSSMPFIVWSVFALILAYQWNLGWMLAAGTIAALGWFATTVVWLAGFPLDISLERPELLFLPAAVLFAISDLPVHRRRGGFPRILRRVALAAAFAGILILSEEGQLSFLRWRATYVEALYQAIGFVVAAMAMWVGVRRRWSETLNIGAAFFAILLFMRYVDWWWNWMPRSLFFLIVAGTAIGALFALRRLRARAEVAS